MAGKNAYQDDMIIEDGKKKDDLGNAAHAAVVSEYDDVIDKEKAVDEGQF